MMLFMKERVEDVLQEACRLIERYRHRCLWFLNEDIVPASPAQAIRLLKYVEKRSDAEGYREARRLREWLSRISSETSAGS